MRELKFRAWHKEHNQMYWFDIRWGNKEPYGGTGYIPMLPFGEERTHIRDERIPLDPDNCEIMQYTGFKDKNDKEVYEGDIREGRYHCGTDQTEYVARQTMVWNQSQLCFEWEGQYIPDFIGIEVIGNIWENPELLEVT